MSSPVPRTGKLSEISPCEVLAFYCRGQETGVLKFQGAGAEKSIFLQKGKIVFASSRDPDDRLGELLLTRGVITREQMDQASSGVAPGKRLGTILVEMGYLPAADLPRWVREQVKEIVFSLFSWGEGEFRFEPGPLTSGEVITLNIPTAEVFLSGLRRVQKWSVLRKGAGEIQIPYRLAPEFQQILKSVKLEKEEQSLLHLLESGCRSMEDAARNSSLTTLIVYQIFYAFRVLGVLLPETVGEEPRKSPSVRAPSVPGPAKPAAPAESREAGPAAGPGPSAPLKRPSPPAVSLSPPGQAAADPPKPAPLRAVPAPSAASPGASAGSAAGAQTVMLKPPSPSMPQPATDAPVSSAPSRKREYKVVRVESDSLEASGTSQIEDLLGSWSRKGFTLAGVVQGRTSGLFSSAPPSFFIFLRD